MSIRLTRVSVGTGLDARVKWPNDVWVNGKKLSGVLTDVNFLGSDIVAIVGVGVNVNQFLQEEGNDLKSTATSFIDILNAPVSREEIFAQICAEFERLLTLSNTAVINEYKKYDMLIGKSIIIMPKRREHPERVEAVALDLDPQTGFLIVRLPDGSTKSLTAEEVSIRPNGPTAYVLH